MEMKIVKTSCRMCHGSCRILVYVKDGKAIKVEGDPNGPINKGTMCSKGLACLDLLYHPDRIKYPLKRKGKRGEGKWQRISWEEAYDSIVAKVKKITEKYGILSISPTVGTGRNPSDALSPFWRKWFNMLHQFAKAVRPFANKCFIKKFF